MLHCPAFIHGTYTGPLLRAWYFIPGTEFDFVETDSARNTFFTFMEDWRYAMRYTYPVQIIDCTL